MGEFFRGWKKKFACMTILLVLLLMLGWMRSLTISESLEFGNAPSITLLHSNDGCVSLEHRNGTVIVTEYARWVSGRYVQRTAGTRSRMVELQESAQNRNDSTTGWKLKIFGFKYGAWMPRDRNGAVIIDVHVLDIPYWSIILPLAGVSAYLLFAKPQQSTPKNTKG